MVDLDTHLTIILRFESILRRVEDLKDFESIRLKASAWKQRNNQMCNYKIIG